MAQSGTVTLAIGGYNAELGRSYGEIAILCRSAFRSQAMGGEPRPNNRRVSLLPRDGSKGTELLDGIVSTWNRVEGAGPIGELFSATLRDFDPLHPGKSVPSLLAARRQIRSLLEKSHDVWLRFKLTELDETIAQCASLRIRATAQSEIVTPGESVGVETEVSRQGLPSLEFVRATLRDPAVENELLPSPVALALNRPTLSRGRWTVPAAQPISQPFWLVNRHGDFAEVPDQALIGQPDDPPLLRVRFQFRTPDGEFEITRPVTYVPRASAAGASPRPVIVAPAVTLRPSARVVIFPNTGAKRVSVRVTANRAGAAGSVRLNLPLDWKSDPARRDFKISSAGENVDVMFVVSPPAAEADASISAIAEIDGRDIAVDQAVVDYPHIEPKVLFPAAAIRLVRVPVEVTAKRIGYIMGTGDEVPAALEQLGCEVTSLSAADIAEADLTRFEAIVLGIRAYNVRPDVQLHRERLRTYAQKGGTLIMQYTVSPQGPNAPVEVPDLGPYPFRVSAARVTVEAAPMTFLQPAHLLLSAPNKISARDFEGWVQERGLHFASQWDPRYETPFESHDPGENPLPGGMLYARHGAGVFIYTSYVWSRQLPAGVPGAYRIFANLLSAGSAAK